MVFKTFYYLTKANYELNMYRIVLLALTVTLFSCVKKGNYTCTCSQSNVLLKSVTYNDINKKNAQDNCNTEMDNYRNADSAKQNTPVACTLN